MNNRILLHIMRLRERLWTRPLLYCLAAIATAFVARAADFMKFGFQIPVISLDTIETLLSIISSTMLAVATFAVGSMLSAYASASSSATPRAFGLVLADDVSQSALSSFIGAFIFSIVSIVALKTGYYGLNGLFALFIFTLMIFALVIMTFVRWVDNVARLGRLENTIDKAETATLKCLTARMSEPYLGGLELKSGNVSEGHPVVATSVGYVQYVDVEMLQKIAEKQDLKLIVVAVPGTFLSPKDTVLLVDGGAPDSSATRQLLNAFVIGDTRTFEADPRFGLVVLSEIAARALSPGVNDPGTAIMIIGRIVGLFARWAEQNSEHDKSAPRFDRIFVRPLQLSEMFDDAFTAIARDGAAIVEVGIRLQKAFLALSRFGNKEMKQQAAHHSSLALDRAENAMIIKQDLARIQRIARELSQS